ncbi:hypothetical protein IF188_11785 [Microbacterium sp. NEAU-LLC]|uniref:Uncharacterized protein n=1 Tax=Microbacterium helvum TaxID=2773713 RepID=A0ABR8NP10_9MICO|nr:hypothetical protein [Microbacterium helvum]MBD3942380.1 hypothetical protein [Microbacterium helvum]
MTEQNAAPQTAPPREPRKSGWLWKFTALMLGAPPLAVYGAEEEIEAERAARSAD